MENLYIMQMLYISRFYIFKGIDFKFYKFNVLGNIFYCVFVGICFSGWVFGLNIWRRFCYFI